MPPLQLKGINLMPTRESFDPIETASRDEIASLQLERLKWTLSHAYNNVAHYKKAFDKAGVHPRDLKTLDDLPSFRSLPKMTCVRIIRSECLPYRAIRFYAFTRHQERPESPPWSATAGAISTLGPA